VPFNFKQNEKQQRDVDVNSDYSSGQRRQRKSGFIVCSRKGLGKHPES